jgi:hypothetical protein
MLVDTTVKAGVLNWSLVPERLPTEEEKYDLVLAADPLYSSEHPAWLVGMIKVWLKNAPLARAVVEMPLRQGYQGERDAFRQGMLTAGFSVMEEGTESGYDDWGTSGGEVRCWWSVWGWRWGHTERTDDL